MPAEKWFLLSLVCYVAHTAKYLTYLLTLRYVLKFDNPHMTQCAKIIVGFVANVGNVFIKRLQTFIIFFYFFHVWYVFLTFFNFYLNIYYICRAYVVTLIGLRIISYHIVSFAKARKSSCCGWGSVARWLSWCWVLPPKEEGYVINRVYLSVCLSLKLLENLWTNFSNIFWRESRGPDRKRLKWVFFGDPDSEF